MGHILSERRHRFSLILASSDMDFSLALTFPILYSPYIHDIYTICQLCSSTSFFFYIKQLWLQKSRLQKRHWPLYTDRVARVEGTGNRQSQEFWWEDHCCCTIQTTWKCSQSLSGQRKTKGSTLLLFFNQLSVEEKLQFWSNALSRTARHFSLLPTYGLSVHLPLPKLGPIPTGY